MLIEPWPGGYVPPDHGLTSGRSPGLLLAVFVHAQGDHRMSYEAGVEINASKVSEVIETDPRGSGRAGDVRIHVRNWPLDQMNPWGLPSGFT